MKTKDQGFGQGYRVQMYKCLKPLHPYTLTPLHQVSTDNLGA